MSEIGSTVDSCQHTTNVLWLTIWFMLWFSSLLTYVQWIIEIVNHSDNLEPAINYRDKNGAMKFELHRRKLLTIAQHCISINLIKNFTPVKVLNVIGSNYWVFHHKRV